jgi:hypothetical protein
LSTSAAKLLSRSEAYIARNHTQMPGHIQMMDATCRNRVPTPLRELAGEVPPKSFHQRLAKDVIWVRALTEPLGGDA